ncbi:MAG TPA: class I SAM-dependent methyltransferase, partial [Gammaproteobacteria bacterium]|nr:class I SAM-dependent methyltransferase [Gammaproteobacteria bacterium]
DYEAHMALPYVGQSQLLGELLEQAAAQHAARSVAVLGCAGGNGFERLPASVERIVGVDLNPDYVATARERHGRRFGPGRLELLVGDVQTEALPFEPVDLIFAALLFEYVDVAATLANAHRRLRTGGALVAVLQLPAEAAEVTPSPYASLEALSPVMRLVPPSGLRSAAEEAGFRFADERTAEASGGKRFRILHFLAEESPHARAP